MKQPNMKLAQSLIASTIPVSWRAMRVVLSALAGCLLMCVCTALVRIPVPGTDVPMTLQLLAVLVVGFSMSPWRAAAAMALYVACGAAGLPVFAGSGGLAGCGQLSPGRVDVRLR